MGLDSGLSVLDVMTLRPVVASPYATIRDVAELMARHGIGSVLIVRDIDAYNREPNEIGVQGTTELLGIVTESDFVRRAILEGYEYNSVVSSIMTKKTHSIAPEADIFEALQMMKDQDVRHLPVLYKGKLAGLVTVKDILRVQPELFDSIVESFQIREEDRKLRAYTPELREDE